MRLPCQVSIRPLDPQRCPDADRLLVAVSGGSPGRERDPVRVEHDEALGQVAIVADGVDSKAAVDVRTPAKFGESGGGARVGDPGWAGLEPALGNGIAPSLVPDIPVCPPCSWMCRVFGSVIWCWLLCQQELVLTLERLCESAVVCAPVLLLPSLGSGSIPSTGWARRLSGLWDPPAPLVSAVLHDCPQHRKSLEGNGADGIPGRAPSSSTCVWAAFLVWNTVWESSCSG